MVSRIHVPRTSLRRVIELLSICHNHKYNSPGINTSSYIHSSDHKCALACIANLLLCCFFNKVLSSSLIPISLSFFWSLYSVSPIVSVSLNTLVLTVAPSLLFFPSLLLCAIFSIKSHNLPWRTICPVLRSRAGVQFGSSFARGRILALRDLATMIMPSSSRRVQAFLRVSLLTASK